MIEKFVLLHYQFRKNKMKIIRTWIKNARAIALPQSLFPAILAFCMAIQINGYSVWLGLLAIMGVICGHLGMNLFDDYFDYKIKESGYRNTLNRKGFRARISKCDYLTSGQATMKDLLTACFIFSIIALSIGFIIIFFRGSFILWISLLTAIIGLSYSAPPLRLCYHGLGELVIGTIFGPLLMIGVFYATCGHWNYSILFVSIPVGMLVTNIVYSHSIMDYEPDKEVGKMTFAILLKHKKVMLIFHQLLINSAYLIISIGIFMKYLSPYYWAVFLTFPLAVYQQYLMVQFIKDPERKFDPKWWMGPMSNWDRIKAGGIDWFMIRWLSARNLLSFFCLICIIISFIP